MVLIASPRGEEVESEQKISVEDTPVEGEKRLPTPLPCWAELPKGPASKYHLLGPCLPSQCPVWNTTGFRC